jgi:hypothetical protein
MRTPSPNLLSTPATRRGYLAPLQDSGKPPYSFLLAIEWEAGPRTFGPATAEIIATLVQSMGADPIVDSAVMSFDLEPQALAGLPGNMLLRAAVIRTDWSQPRPQIAGARYLLNTGAGTTVYREDVPTRMRRASALRREGKLESWFPEGALWRGSPTLVFVDVDEYLRVLSPSVLRSALGDFWVASGESATYQNALQGHAQSFDAEHGRLRSPAETLKELESERSQAAGRIGQQHYPASLSLSGRKRRSLLTALGAQAGISKREAWRQARRDTLADVLARAVPDELDAFHEEISPESVANLAARLVSKSRALLADAVADRLLGPAWRQRWCEYPPRPDVADANQAQDYALEQVEREQMIDALKLTPLERDLVDASEHGVPLTRWALDCRVPLSEARRLMEGIRARARMAFT